MDTATNTSKIKLSILMPVRNEGANIGIMLKILGALIEVPYEILIVYDDIKDDTIDAVKSLQLDLKNVKLVHNTIGRGVANAIRSGLNMSRGDYVLIFAADEVGPVLAIDDMIALMDEGCDIVSCTRYAHGGRRLGGSFLGGLLSKLGNRLFRFISGSAFTDSTTGIKMFRKSAFDRIRLESEPVGWVVVFELAIKAQVAGLKLGEVPIISIDRLYGGKSTFSPGPWLRAYLKWGVWGINHLHTKAEKQKLLVRIPSTTLK